MSFNFADYQPLPRPINPNLPDLDDECFCSNTFREKPAEDGRSFRLISKTECNHFFHDYCLTQWLDKSAHKNCPNCRADINATKLIKTNLDWKEPVEQPRPAVPSPIVHRPAAPRPVARPVIHRAPAPRTAPVTVDESKGSDYGMAGNLIYFGLSTTGWLLNQTISYLFSSPEAVKKAQAELKKAEGTKVGAIYKKWEGTTKDIANIIHRIGEESAVLLQQVNSLPANRIETTNSSLRRFEVQTELFKKRIMEAEKDFAKFIKDEQGILSRAL